MAWNGYRGDWQEGWNGWKSSVWYEQPTEGSYAHTNEDYGAWQPSHSMGPQTSGGYGTNARPSATQSRAEPPKPKLCSFDALRALQGPDSDDESDTDAGVSRFTSDNTTSTAGSGSPIKSRSDSSDDEKREVGKAATQAEREEAEEVIRTALRDQKERDGMRSKVGTASPADLQAMLNARLKR